MQDQIQLKDFVKGFVLRAYQIPKALMTINRFLRIPAGSQLTLGWQIEQNARLFSLKDGLFFESEKWTHEQINQISYQYARSFKNKGISRHDRVAVLSENRPELLFAIIGLAKIGAVAGLINPKVSGESLSFSLSVEKFSAFIVDQDKLKSFQEVKLPTEERTLLLLGSSGLSLPNGFVSLDVESQESTNLPDREHTVIDDPFALVFTSGTTGLPKASFQTHRRWFAAMNWFGRIVLRMKLEDRYYITLPFCHTNALHVAWAAAAGAGAAIVMRKKFSASEFWEDASRYQFTHCVYVGELCRYLLNQPTHPIETKHYVRAMCGNGLRPEAWSEFKSRFKIKNIYEFYGAAESPLLFTNILNLERTVGVCPTKYAVLRYDIEIDSLYRNGNGYCEEVEAGSVGLPAARLDHKIVFIGYTSFEETQKKLLRNIFSKGDLFFNSGDLVKKLGFGHIAFVDRLGDTFRWKGENVATTEVEQISNGFPGIKESCCYGIAVDGFEGRVGLLALVIDGDEKKFDAEGLWTYLKTELPEYAVPRFLRFCQQFETTATSKVIRRSLQEDGLGFASQTDPLLYLDMKAQVVRTFCAPPRPVDLQMLA